MRHVRMLFLPAEWLLGRMRYAAKMLLLAAVLVGPPLAVFLIRKATGTEPTEPTGPWVDGLVATTLLVGVYLLISFYLSATDALRRIVVALRALAGGDLTIRVTVGSADEVGAMAAAFNETVTQLRQALETLSSNALSVTGSSTELSDVSRRLRDTAEHTSVQAELVSTAASQVTANVDLIAHGAEKMGASMDDVAQGAAKAVTVAEQASVATEASNQAVARLGRSSAEIGDVVKVITAIAEQINLLALNATIEAARAASRSWRAR